MIMPSDPLNNKEDVVVEVEGVKVGVGGGVGQGGKMLEGGDDESDFSDDCQMDFDVIKDLWVRKQKKPLWLAEAPRAKNTTLQPLAKIPPTAWPENTAPM